MNSGPKRRRRKRRSRPKRIFRKCLTFICSHVGLAMISAAYMVAGAFIFKFIEAPHEALNRWDMEIARRQLKHDSWFIIRDNHTTIDELLLIDTLHRRLSKFKIFTIGAIKRGYDGRPQLDNIQWSYPGAFFYSMTTISTVGYGNIAPRTTLGRAVTIGYAIFGIPLMLLFLAITGDTFSITCKFLYRACIRLRIRFLRWRFNRRQEARFNSSLSQLVRDELYHTVSVYGIDPPDAPIDEKLLSKGEQDVESVSVPLVVLITLMITYLVAGATLFCFWEGWTFDEGFYFCFVSLALIGFGDLFPGGSVIESWAARTRIIICAFYLLFGMALLAMCFNLTQDNVVKKLRQYALRYGFSKSGDGRRESKVLDPRDVIVEGGPIGGPDEIPPLTVRDIQGSLLKSKLLVPVFYGSTGKTLRRQATAGVEQARIYIGNGTLSLLSDNASKLDSKGRRYAYDSNTTRAYVALTKNAYILEGRRSL